MLDLDITQHMDFDGNRQVDDTLRVTNINTAIHILVGFLYWYMEAFHIE